MQSLKISIVVSAIIFCIMGCDATNNRFTKYYKYQDTPADGTPLVLPGDLSDKALVSNYYVIPKISITKVRNQALLLPPGSNLSRFAKK